MMEERQLTREEKRLIEREFIAREEARAKRRRFCQRVFILGTSAGGSAALLSGFEVHTPAVALLQPLWLVCLLAYVGGEILPTSFRKDMNPFWHLNPWKDALQNLSEGRTLVEALTLLAGPTLLAGTSSLIYFSLE